MRILFVTDAWHPQLNGVVRTIEETCCELQRRGHITLVISPEKFHTIALPTYRDIRLALPSRAKLTRLIKDFAPDYFHVATEGPLGWAARGWCKRNKVNFTTAYHSRFPEYLAARLPIPSALTYNMLRRFHNAASAVLAPTQSIADDLTRHGFKNLFLWTRGVDTGLFQPTPGGFAGVVRPILLYAGRVAKEKNLAAFLDITIAGTKVVVGDGPQMTVLKCMYPDAHFAGRLEGEDLARAYSAADIFVFPSLTDTFGLVMAEALACGTPIAAYDVTGPRDVLDMQDSNAPVGVLSSNLEIAVRSGLEKEISVQRCRDYVMQNYTWARATDQFLDIHVQTCDPVRS